MLFVPGVGDPNGPTLSDNAVKTALNNFRSFVGRLEDLYEISLPVPQVDSLSSLKKFCSGLLLPSSGHLWSRPVRGLRLRDRLSIAGSLFLFRKTLPAVSPSLSAYADKLSSPAPDPAAGYLSFCSSELKKMFPVGWDRGYARAVEGTCVRPASCRENPRSRGGARGMLLRGWCERADFCKSALDKYASPGSKRVNLVRAVIAPCDGKDRIVTVNSVDMTYLTPYHTTLYDHVSRQEWCLRGTATSKKFGCFTQMDDELFVSGDYESATDNLNRDVASHILGFINRTCSHVPLWIRDLASSTLECEIEIKGRSKFEMKRGQLMGNALSFPLLCLQNYLAFKFLVPRNVPVRINGDDIVFRARYSEYQTWKAGVLGCGLTLSEGKTAVSRNWFSLNSTFFVAGTKRVREAPVIRSTAFFKKLDKITSLKGRMETCNSFRPDRRDRLHTYLLGRYRSAVFASERSLTRGLEIRVSRHVIFRSNLAERESFYLSLDKYYDPPVDAEYGYYRGSVPEGWIRERSRVQVDQEVQREFFRELVAETWKPVVAQDSEQTRKFTSSFVPYPVKFAKMLRLSNREILRRRTLFSFPKKADGTLRWVKNECGAGLSGGSV
nr:TPA_asm: RNA-dependent RNA polymerase [Mansourli virus 1]